MAGISLVLGWYMVGQSLSWTINGVDRELVGGISVFMIILRKE
jgi:hypothetical protein